MKWNRVLYRLHDPNPGLHIMVVRGISRFQTSSSALFEAPAWMTLLLQPPTSGISLKPTATYLMRYQIHDWLNVTT